MLENRAIELMYKNLLDDIKSQSEDEQVKLVKAFLSNYGSIIFLLYLLKEKE